MDREAMLKRVQEHDFALVEANLFLDTHPCDRTAQEYFKSHLSAAQAARREYEAKYGPLKAENYEGGAWTWVCDPWPWENLGRYE